MGIAIVSGFYLGIKLISAAVCIGLIIGAVCFVADLFTGGI